MSSELIHFIDSPFHTRKVKYFTVFSTAKTFDLLISNRFYLTLLPVTGQLISLTVTTENLENKFDHLHRTYNKIVMANLSPTNERDNYVTHGRFSIYDVSDKIYGLYLESLNFNIITTPPIVIGKEIAGIKQNEIVGKVRHFQWINYSRYGKESIDVTFNTILVNFPKENIRYAKQITVSFKGQNITGKEILGKMLVAGNNGTFSFVSVRFLFDVSLYNVIVKNELTTCVLQVLTLYNLKNGGKDVPPINFVVSVTPFFGSFEELIPFCCNSFSTMGILRKCMVDKRLLERMRLQALEGSPEFDMDIHTESQIYNLREHQDKYEFLILRTDSFLKFIRATILSDTGKFLLESTLSSDNVQESLQQLINQLKSSSFIEGVLVNPNLRKAILASFQD
ncbi:MAG: hypothetical protein QXV17_07380 [Candidatus Micrarchaeaceae archaeon]